jgi:hypothetical protein
MPNANNSAALKLFSLLPDVEMVWVVSKERLTLETSSLMRDVCPEGNYLILKVTEPFTAEAGLFQVPRPKESKAKEQK